jgi:hypothetical protein
VVGGEAPARRSGFARNGGGGRGLFSQCAPHHADTEIAGKLIRINRKSILWSIADG